MNEQKEIKICQSCHREFIIEPDDFAFYQKIDVPPPTFCPECRMVRRMMWRNERSLYKRRCGFCGAPIISMYFSEENRCVYCRECWYSEKWDGISYGVSYDWNLPFFEQLKKLFREVPIFNFQTIRANTGSEYINFGVDNKNCYLSFSIVSCENVLYASYVDRDKECLDSFYLKDSQLCYFNIDSEKNYRCFFTFKSKNCIDSLFLFDCINCTNCFMSSNLRNKQYIFRNVQCTKEEYERKIAEIDTGKFQILDEIKAEFYGLINNKSLHKFAYVTNSSNCVGNEIDNSKNSKYVFGAYNVDNVSYVVRAFSSRDSRDSYGLAKGEFVYEGFAQGYECNDVAFLYFTDAVRESRYINHCYSSSHLFGCIGLRNKEYCILNKQYTKEEYEVLLPKIKQHMNDMPYVDSKGRIYKYGEFFPPELSPFAYNETIAQEYFPLTKEQAISQGYRWKDPDTKEYKITKKTNDLPDHIKDVPDSITNEIIECNHSTSSWQATNNNTACTHQCTTAFKIIPEELSFYRRMNLPLPRLCPNCRHYERLSQRNPLKLWHRKCMCGGTKSENQIYQNTSKHEHGEGRCPNEFETSYSPERPEIVYCEQCYQNEVV